MFELSHGSSAGRQKRSVDAGEGMSEPGNSSQAQPSVVGAIGVSLSMTLGIISNIVALFILVSTYHRQRRRTKASFLLFATSLVSTDLLGHVILGALVLRLYLSEPKPDLNSSDSMCQFLGSCMVFFGLCPLFLGCVMAAERCLGVTRPLLHSSLVTKTRTKSCLSAVWLAALSVAVLPCFHVGSYTYQQPGTWCFINVFNGTDKRDVAFVAMFSGLGLASLAVALVCNTVSGLTLVLARLRRKPGSHRSARSHDIEMVVQLVGIMVTSCICWSPLLVSIREGLVSGQLHSQNKNVQDILHYCQRWQQYSHSLIKILILV